MSKYEYIDSQKTDPVETNPVTKMCLWLVVSTSGYYHWQSRPQSATAARRGVLAARIRHFFAASDGTYGYRRIHADLADESIECSPELVRQIMRQESLVPCQPRPFRVTTDTDAVAAALMPDLVTRDFTADRPGRKFVGDITYIHTGQGFIYLATVIDCYSKKVVGWSIADHMRTELVADALRNAAATSIIEPSAIGPGKRLHLGRLPGAGDRPRDAVLDGQNRCVLGQRDGRIVLLRAEERTRLSNRLCHKKAGQTRRHRLHRRVLQQPETALRTRIPQAQRSPLQLPAASHGSIRKTSIRCPKFSSSPMCWSEVVFVACFCMT